MIDGTSHLLVDDYRYLEPDDPTADLTVEEYGAFLSERYDQLHDVAELYVQMLENVRDAGDGTAGRLAQHWERYMDAASTVHRVKHELTERGKLAETDAYWLDEMGEGRSNVVEKRDTETGTDAEDTTKQY